MKRLEVTIGVLLPCFILIANTLPLTTVIPSQTTLTSTTVIPSQTTLTSTTVIPSQATLPSTTVIPPQATLPSTTVIPSQTTLTSTTVIPSQTTLTSTTVIPSQATLPTTTVIPPQATLPSTTVIPSQATLPSTTVIPPQATLPSTTGIPSQATLPSTTVIPPQATRPSTTVIPPQATLPSTTVIPSQATLPSTTVIPPQTNNTLPSTTVIPQQTTDTLPSTIVIPPQATNTLQSTAVIPQQATNTLPSTIVISPQATNILTSTTVIPPQATNILPSTTVIPPQATNILSSTTVIPPQATNTLSSTTVIPPQATNTLPLATVIPPQTTNILPSTTVIPLQTSNTLPSTTVIPPQPTNTLPSTTVIPPQATNTLSSTTVIPPHATNTLPLATVIPPQTTNILPSTTVIPLQTINTLPSTTVIPPQATNTLPLATVIPPQTTNILPSTTVIPLQTINTLPSTTVIPPQPTNTLPSTTVIPPHATDCPTYCSCVAPTITCNDTIPDNVPDDIVEVVLVKLTNGILASRRFCDVTWPSVRILFLDFYEYEYPIILREHVFDCLGQIQSLAMRNLEFWMTHTAGVFHGFTNVTTLDVSQSHLITYDYTRLFSDRSNFPKLRHFNLSQNDESLYVDQRFIDALSSSPIELLDLSYNQEVTYDFGNSSALCQTLKTMILHDSRMIVKQLPYDQCDSLQYVDLSGNQDVTQPLKQCVDSYTFLAIYVFLVAEVMRLDHVLNDDKGSDTSNCVVWMERYSTVRELYFSDNYIPHFEIMFDEPILERLILSHNHIKSINQNAFLYLPSLLTIDLSFNNLNEMPNLEDTFKNLFRRNEYLTSIDLSSNGLTYQPDETFHNNPNLNEILLSHNSFTQLPLNVSTLRNLELLDLRYNDIQYLDDNSMQKVELIYHTDNLRLGQENAIPQVLLEGNPFTCKCEALRFLQWFVASPIFNSTYTCDLDGRTIPMTEQAVHEASDDCERPMRRRRTIALSTVLPAVAIAMIVTMVIILKRRYKRRLEQQQFDDTLQLIREEDTGFPYTVFLAYSSIDRDFVIKHIREPMELKRLCPDSEAEFYIQAGIDKEGFESLGKPESGKQDDTDLETLTQPLGKPESGNQDDTDLETLKQEEETDTMSKPLGKPESRNQDDTDIETLTQEEETDTMSKEPNVRICHEPALDLAGGECQPATYYTKRPHVFRLKLAIGAEYLFMAKDEVEMVHWVNRINATTESASPRRSQTLPVRTEEQKESKKKRLFTMKKK